ncbi:conserved hypothetical protein [Sphingomonas sp. T1]|uniref:hypothetical protein n=1 Tax=Sphingomonas sp. T1 TaxID=2653172 RepID=UPI0012F0A757|nr:hypothetical protein [Sphingomonas sp. T1]VXD01436.1 conserved hypothetical protein [Sphingomonas sp. T1]
MTRTKLDLSEFDETPPNKDPARLREISDVAGFPSRPAVPAVAKTAPVPAPADHPQAATFQRPPRATGNRNIAINVRVDPETAARLYALRDADPSRKRVLADVIEDATLLLYERELGAAGR